MSEELDKALQEARELEIDGADYYTQMAKKCSVESGKQMFHSFAADEKRHLRIIEDFAKGLGVDVEKFPMPRDEILTLFSEKKQELEETSEVSSDEHEAIREAMEMETKSFQLYAIPPSRRRTRTRRPCSSVLRARRISTTRCWRTRSNT